MDSDQPVILLQALEKHSANSSNATGRFLFHILAAVDELQREIIVGGTHEGWQQLVRVVA